MVAKRALSEIYDAQIATPQRAGTCGGASVKLSFKSPLLDSRPPTIDAGKQNSTNQRIRLLTLWDKRVLS
jgi:hypothetical protein